MLNNEDDNLPIITVMVGISCSGKSHYANTQADIGDDTICLEEDSIYNALCGWDKRDAQEQLQKQKYERITSLVRGVIKKTLSAAIAAGFNVIYDTDMIRRTQLTRLTHMLDDVIGEYNYKLRFIITTAETHECQLAYQKKYSSKWEQTYHITAEEELIKPLVSYIERHYRNSVYYE